MQRASWTTLHTISQPRLLQLAQATVISRRLMFGTSVYLLPLRHPVPVAKQVASLDHLTEGRFIFGVGVGGEFPKEYEASGVPLKERGARLEKGIPLLRELVEWRAGDARETPLSGGIWQRHMDRAGFAARSISLQFWAWSHIRLVARVLRHPMGRAANPEHLGWHGHSRRDERSASA